MTKSSYSISNITQDFIAQGERMTPLRTKSIRASFGLSQSKFADLLGISVRTLQNWEGGYKNPSGPSTALLYLAETQPQAFLKNRKKLLEQIKKLALI